MDQGTVKKRVVGVDISLDATSFALVDVRGNILAKDSFPTEDYPEIGGFITALTDGIMKLIEANGGFDIVRSVGVSVPSANFMTGNIVNSPNFPWKGVAKNNNMQIEHSWRMAISTRYISGHSPDPMAMAKVIPVCTAVDRAS